MTTKMIEAQAQPLDMCKFKFYKRIFYDEVNNETVKTIVEVQIDTSIGKQHVSIVLTDEQMLLNISELFDELYDTAITQWQNS